MSVITLSRQVGAGAEELVEIIRRKLGYLAFDKQKIGDVIASYGLHFDSMEKYDEKKPSFWEFISRERSKFQHAVQIALCQAALNGNVILIGRGGYMLLKDIPGVLRVRIIAPFEMRVRTMTRTGAKPDEIERMLRDRDRESEGFIRHHYQVDWNNPTLYDVVMNMENMSHADAAQLIMEECRHRDRTMSDVRAQEKLADLTLKLKIELAVMQDVKLDIRNLDVTVTQGNAVLSGIVSHEQVKHACQEAALRVEGIKHLDNRITIASILPHPYEW